MPGLRWAELATPLSANAKEKLSGKRVGWRRSNWMKGWREERGVGE